MKCRLGKPPLTPMEFTFTGEQTFAKQSLGALQNQALHKVLVVCYENVFD